MNSEAHAEQNQATGLWAKGIAVTAAYFIFGYLGLQIPYVGSNITLIWFPTGISLVAAYLWGARILPAIFVGALAVNLSIGSPLWVAIGISLGNTLAPSAAALLLRRLRFNPRFGTKEDVTRFVLAAMAGMVLSATGGTAVLTAAGLIPPAMLPNAWITWWAGDTVGALLIAPLLFNFSRQHLALVAQRPLEASAFGLSFAGLLWMIFRQQDYSFPLALALASLLLIFALRFSVFWTSVAVAIISSLAALATALGHSPFIHGDTTHSLLILWGYMTLLAIFSLMIVALDTDNRTKAESLTLHSKALGAVSEGVLIADADRRISYANDSFLDITGFRLQELFGAPCLMPVLSLPTSPQVEILRAGLENAVSARTELQNLSPDGRLYWLDCSLSPVFDEHGSLTQFVLVISEITDRKKAEGELRIAATAFESHEGIMVLDEHCRIQRVNKAFSDITAFSFEEVIGETPRILHSDKHDADFYENMWASIHANGQWQGEIWNRRKDGAVYPEYLTITALRDAEGKVCNYVGSFVDISKIKAAEKKIEHLAFYDALTDLPNRRLLMDRLLQALTYSTRHGRSGALLFIDLDNFKTLNDTLGHETGDQLLRQVAQRLLGSVREGDTVARLGGDEFVVMLEDLSGSLLEASSQTEAVAMKILGVLSQPYLLSNREFRNTPSIGATLFMGSDQSVDELLKQADIAMYQAKKAGRNTVRFFDPELQSLMNDRMALESELFKAIERDEFRLYFQIQVNSAMTPVGAEALLRWHHPLKGTIAPSDFIPLAEETGLILSIGEWVLHAACQQLEAWQQYPEMRALPVSVNVSAKQLHQANFVNGVKAIVEGYDINPSLLKFEVTETMLLENVENIIDEMHALSALGIQFSLDDFGTGYSSLQYLKRLPLQQLKIDRSFVQDIAHDANDQSIVSTMIAMAQNLGMHVIAEGVETEEQLSVLHKSGCSSYQGYLFAEPAPHEVFLQLCRQHGARSLKPVGFDFSI